MAKLTISDAARACRVARSTLQRAINAGRLSLDPDHRVDTAELIRSGYTLHAAQQDDDRRTLHEALQDAAPRSAGTRQDTAVPGQSDAALMQQRIAALERENTLLHAALDAAAAREQEAREERHAARDREALLLHMVEQMHQRYDRLIEAPRQTVTVPLPPVPKASTPRRGADRQASGQTFDPIRHVLGRLCPRGHDYQGMGQSVRRRSNHLCVACDTELTRERRKAKREGAQ